jgi:hypothetical protein
VRGLFAAIVAACGIYRAAGAQVQVEVEVEPVIGVYSEFSDWIQPGAAQPVTGLRFGFPDTLSQRTGLTLGGQATAWVRRRMGLRASLLTSSSEVGPATHDLLNRDPVSARVTTAGLEALVTLTALPTGGRVFLVGGAAIIRRSGDAYHGFEGTKDLAGMFGVGSQLRLTDRLNLQADLRMLLYQLRLTDPDGMEYPSAFQTDV